MHSPTPNRRAGFTVFQLIFLIGLLTLALAFLMPIIAQIRAASMRAQATNNLKQLALSMHIHHDVYKVFPPGVGTLGTVTGPTHFHILPFIEQDPLFQSGNGAPWKNGVYETVIPVFLDLRDESLPGNRYRDWLATTNFPVNWMVTRDGDQTIANIADGTSNTLCFAERYQLCNGQPTAWGYPTLYTWAPIFAYYSEEKFQTAPSQDQCDPRLAQSIGNNMLVAMCDGSVRTLSPSILPSTWYYLCDPNDGQPLPQNAFD
jgi:hypothetical protein